MSPRALLLAVNIVGGIAVLASYFFGASSPHATNGGIWGGVPDSARSLYTVSMFAAATGYFPFTYVFAFDADPRQSRFMGAKLGLVSALYSLVLIPSALWLPLTNRYLDTPTPGGWIGIQLVLACAAVASLALMACLTTMTPRPKAPLRIAAITGCTFFCFQTVVLDACVWVGLFPS